MDRVVIVGEGLLGTMHAVQARSPRMDVVHLDDPLRYYRAFSLPGRSRLAPQAPAVAAAQPGPHGMTCSPAIAEKTFAG